jgi:hypothetical protein
MTIARRGCLKALRLNSTRRVGAISNRGCAREFHAAVSLLGGRTRSLRDATYITGISKKESAPPEWQVAMGVVMGRGGPTMFARIGIVRADGFHQAVAFWNGVFGYKSRWTPDGNGCGSSSPFVNLTPEPHLSDGE